MAKAAIILLIIPLCGMLPRAISGATAGLSPLDAISMIETGNNDAAIGQAGEVSRYQIRPAVWHQFTRSTAYEDSVVASYVAGRYLDWLSKYYNQRAGRTADDFDLYVMWNAGAAYYRRIGFAKERVHPTVRARAERFANLRRMPPATAVKPQTAPLPATPSVAPALASAVESRGSN